MLLLSVSACEDFKFGNDFLDKPITTDVTIDTVFSRRSTVPCPTFSPQAEDCPGRHWSV